MMARLLIVHRTSSPSMQAMFEAVLSGARNDGVEVVTRPALTASAVRAVESLTTGLRWRRARPPVTVAGEVGPGDLEACWELGATVAAGLVS